jgi:CPA2 family monovalent cation:H+ antiporter-2
MSLDLLSATGRDLILGGAILSILLNPLLFVLLERAKPWLKRREQAAADARMPASESEPMPWAPLQDHAVLVGFGRVGHHIAASLREREIPFIVIEDHREVVKALRADGIPAINGDAAAPGVMEAANVKQARWLLAAIPNPLEAAHVIAKARMLNPQIEAVARAQTDAELAHFEKHGATHTVVSEKEVAKSMAACVLAPSHAPD